ncbi:hypothetical protein FUAX_29580 [Fulvitalea axinellae]|uniref:Twin-arginine translocation signal domain-containing protein n=1 Tax=Fulvitalea axinellae TaxID=1182444 RepID=A0AAU9DBN8_9BACT|nr:hypothetical protein FUAX_29580 [Fulvitalea axinellae]
MDRRDFLKTSALAAGAVTLGCNALADKGNGKKLLNAYYFRAHMYTLVPRHIREDLRWMADLGTDVVSVAVLEQDLYAARENIDLICAEADKLGMEVHAVPSRWGGLVAGAPKVPSTFTCRNPQTWMLGRDGKPVDTRISGRISSVHYPETLDFMSETALQLLKQSNIKGLIWDEPKSLGKDYSPKAIENLGKDAPKEAHIQANVDFYSELNRRIKAEFADCRLGMFLQAHYSDTAMNKCATIKHMDDFGCDGRPWGMADGGKLESKGKVLLGEKAGERFLKAAKENGKNSLWLVENHNMSLADAEVMERGLKEVVKREVDHLIYYYYPRNLEDPEKIMKVIQKGIKPFKA